MKCNFLCIKQKTYVFDDNKNKIKDHTKQSTYLLRFIEVSSVNRKRHGHYEDAVITKHHRKKLRKLQGMFD